MHIAVLLFLFGAQTAEDTWTGGRLEHLPAGIELTLPPGWKARLRPEEEILDLEVFPPEEDLQILVYSSPAQIFGRIKESIEKEISSVITHPEVRTVGNPRDVNDLVQLTAGGYGLYRGEIVDWEARIVNGGPETLFIIMVGALDNHRAELSRIFRSIHTVPIEEESEERENDPPD